MTPEEIIERTNKVRQLQERLAILNNKDARLVVFFDTTRPIIRTQNSVSIFLDQQLEDFARFVAETIRTKTILDIVKEIEQLCNLQESTPTKK